MGYSNYYGLFMCKKHFSEFKKDKDYLSNKVLSNTLSKMEEMD